MVAIRSQKESDCYLLPHSVQTLIFGSLPELSDDFSDFWPCVLHPVACHEALRRKEEPGLGVETR